MKTTIEKFINVLCLDFRIRDGIFSIEDNNHMNILEEHLVKYGVELNEARDIRNRVVEGRFPERQAYNKNGILVTFPTPEYKDRAIKRGTHFEENPVKKQPNIFSTQQPTQQPAQQPAQPQQQEKPTEQPVKQKTDSPREEPSKLQPAPATQPVATTPVAPVAQTPQQPIATPVGVSQPTGSQQPVVLPTDASVPQSAVVIPPSEKKTPEQKQAEAEYVEKLLKTEISIDEAKNLGWKCNLKGEWYDASGTNRGRTTYNESLNKRMISSI